MKLIAFSLAILATIYGCAIRESGRTVLSNRDADAPLSQSANLSAGMTAFSVAGPQDGVPVVLIHGVSGPMAVWDRTVPALVDAGYRVIRFDLYGRGESERVKADHSLELYVQQLDDLLAELEITRQVTLVGSSMGTMIASEFAQKYPDRIEKLALIGPAGFPLVSSPLANLMNVPGLGEVIMGALGHRKLVEHNANYFYRPEVHREFLDDYERQLRTTGSKRAILSTFRHVPLQDYLEGFTKLGELGKDIMIVWGREDKSFPYAHHRAALAAMPEAGLASIAAAGHLPQYEQAEQVNEVLLNFLRNNELPSLMVNAARPLQYRSSVSYDLSGPVIDNGGEFYSDFFQQFNSTPTAVLLQSDVSKIYEFPTFYGDVTVAQAIFFCSYDEARKLVLDTNLKPLSMGQGRTAVVISSYRYKKVRGMESYSEIAIAIPVVRDRQINIPVVPMLFNGFEGFGAYVVDMPVTSFENQLRGEKIWGLPKATMPIKLYSEGSSYFTQALSEDGEPWLTLSVPMNGSAVTETKSVDLYTSLGGEALISKSTWNGTFVERRSLKSFFFKNTLPDREYINLGEGVRADFLRNLSIEPMPFAVRFATGVESVFEAP